MSLHTLANHMAATGRGPDSTLVHMSPREVNGLQALAMANGGSLTINPQTGLPEAGFLENLLPALAGFALNAFAPGVGGAVGGALGLTGAAAETAGTGLLVGGATGLATGSLEKGLMAGLGAYGGAGLESNLNAAGKTALETASSAGSNRGAFLPGAETSPSGTLDRLKAGLGSFSEAPGDALKNNAMNFGLAAAPALAGTFDDQKTNAIKPNPGNILIYKKDPATGKSYVDQSIPGDQAYRAPGFVYGNANGGLIQHYDGGGATSDTAKKGIAWGNVLDPDLTGHDMNDTRSDSQKAQDYLMGKGPNPFLFYSKPPVVDPVAKASEATKTLQEDIKQEQQQRSGGNSSRAMDDSGGIASLGDASSKSGWDTATDLGLKAANSGIPGLTQLGDKILSRAEEAKGNTALARNTVQDPMQRQQAAQIAVDAQIARENEAREQARASEQAMAEKVAADNATAAIAAQAQQAASERAAQQAEKQAAVERAVANENDSNQGNSSSNGGSGYSGAPAAGSDVGRSEPGSAHLSRGGYLSRYADGGGVSGGGSLELHVPVSIGGGVGGGLGSLGGGNGIQQGGMRQPNPDFLQQQQQNLPGFQAMQKAQQDYTNSDEYKGFQQYAQQYQQNAGNQMGGAFGSSMGGARGGFGMAEGGIAALAQGEYNLGSYSDGGRLLRGPGDGVSDDIPATIGENQPARLADGEFVVPARIVSELGNGSTEAGARKLYAMMDRVQKSRSKTTGKDRVAANTRADKYLPA